ncbi:autotransporter outer membrane beta-barrel domain-containing protein [Mesorhizobium sp. 1B3]
MNAGLGADLRENIAVYANVDYQIEFDGLGEAIGGEIGLRVRW